MEILEQLTPLISSVGFPIVCCFFMWRYISDTLESFRTAIATQNELLKRICDKLDLDIAERKKDI